MKKSRNMIPMCQICGQAPATRVVRGVFACGKQAHGLDSYIERKRLKDAQRAKREAEDNIHQPARQAAV
jgi:hypothetical protein